MEADEQAESSETALQGTNEGHHSENQVKEQAAEEESNTLPADKYYNYEEIHSRPFVTPDSEIPENLLYLCHSFGYDSGRRGNLQLLDDTTLIFIAGNILVLLDFCTKKQKYLRSCSGGGIGSITVHPNRKYFAVAEKGNQPNVIVYEYPSLQPYRILRGGTECAYSFVNFNSDGSLLASLGNAPDYMLTLWNWMQEKVVLSCKAISQEVYRVSFSPHNPILLTSSGSRHIKFWKMANSFTGLKLQGLIGHFGKTTATDIEGYMELPDGKVVSGSSWGNLLLWDDCTIQLEICREKGRNCHTGTVQPFALEDGQLMTMGTDGAVRVWDIENIVTAEGDESRRFELEPMNELMVGHHVCLTSMVKSSQPDSFIWFAQDSSGAIWKLDLSFTNTTLDPECLFSFHAGPITGLDVSNKSYLMATTALNRSVSVFDFLTNRELTSSRFNQGGTVISWAPHVVTHRGGLLVTGFEDGVIRLLELYDPQKLPLVSGRHPKGDAKLRLKQAFKPHNASVTAVAYDQSGKMFATGSSDCTVFFFTVGEKYNPVGFFRVPGPVQALEWSSRFYKENRLLILCQSSQVFEVHSPNPESQKNAKTYHLANLPTRSFKFRSIKSRIKREDEIARRQALKELKEKESKQQHIMQYKEEEEELPPIYIPDHPSRLYCGFYSQPDQFWLSMGDYDSGYLYHCKFSKKQNEDPDERQDEPFNFIPIHNADDDPICSISFSSNRQLLLCGMHSGFIRVYPLKPGDNNLTSMQAYWTLSVHDNQYGHLRHIRCSYDNEFVLTAGDDGNIFSFSLRPPAELKKGLQKTKAKVPTPRKGLESEAPAQDISLDAYSLETARQKLEKDCLRREAEQKMVAKRKMLSQLQQRSKELLSHNQSLPEHVRLMPSELQELDQSFSEQAKRLMDQNVTEVRMRLYWEEERCNIALSKLQGWDFLEATVVTVVAISTNHRISTFRLPVLRETSSMLRKESTSSRPDEDTAAAPELKKYKPEPAKDSSKLEDEVVPHPPPARPTGIKLAGRQVERLRKAAEKAELARAKMEERKQKWAQLYAEKPSEDCEDPQYVEAIQQAKKTIGDLKLKSAKDYKVPKHLRMNAERKRQQLIDLEKNILEKQTEMNERIMALRDLKIHLLSQLRPQAQQVKKVQQRLAPHHHCPIPSLPKILPEEIPEKRLQCSHDTLERYRLLKEQRAQIMQQEGTLSLLDQLEKDMEGKAATEEEEEEKRGDEGPLRMSASSVSSDEEGIAVEEEEELNNLEKELQREEEIRLLYEQDSLLEQMERSVSQFDAELQLLRQEKLCLYPQLKLADLRQLTLYQELLLLKEFERRKDCGLQERLKERIKEEKFMVSKLEACSEQLEQKRAEVAKLQERLTALSAAFQASVRDSEFEEFLTKVFKKKIKRVQKKEQTKDDEEEEEESDEDSDWDDDWDDDDFDSDTEDGGVPLDDSVCPPGCEPELFEKILQMRERRLDLEDMLVEKKKSAEALKNEWDTFVKKEKIAKNSRRAAEDDMELVLREERQKTNELDVVVALCLSQIAFIANDSVPSDLSPALLLNRTELRRLQERIKELQVENIEQRDLRSEARQQQVRLIHELKDMDADIQQLEKELNQQMMIKFGRPVDLEALWKLSANSTLEELKQEKLFREATYDNELDHWDVMVGEAHQSVMEVIMCNTKRLHSLTSLLRQKGDLEQLLKVRQNIMGRQFQDSRRRADEEEFQELQDIVETQSQQVEALRREISLLSRKDGPIVLPHTPLPPLTPPPTQHIPHGQIRSRSSTQTA